MTHKQKRKFFDWLQKYGALKAYKRARYQQKMISSNVSYKELLFREPILYSFRWSETSEGAPFWSNLNSEWRNYLAIDI